MEEGLIFLEGLIFFSESEPAAEAAGPVSQSSDLGPSPVSGTAKAPSGGGIEPGEDLSRLQDGAVINEGDLGRLNPVVQVPGLIDPEGRFEMALTHQTAKARGK